MNLKSIHLTFVLGLACLFMAGNAQALCVTASEANLRAGPGTHYKKTWVVYQYMPLQRIGHKGSWVHVKDLDGERHWVHKSLLGKRTQCAVVKSARANIRTGPGTRYRQTDWSPIDSYYSLKILKKNGSWLKVRDEVGNTGWVAKSLLWVR